MLFHDHATHLVRWKFDKKGAKPQNECKRKTHAHINVYRYRYTDTRDVGVCARALGEKTKVQLGRNRDAHNSSSERVSLACFPLFHLFVLFCTSRLFAPFARSLAHSRSKKCCFPLDTRATTYKERARGLKLQTNAHMS